jgi:hypothetical protein
MMNDTYYQQEKSQKAKAGKVEMLRQDLLRQTTKASGAGAVAEGEDDPERN